MVKPAIQTTEHRRQAGKSLRTKCPRAAHGSIGGGRGNKKRDIVALIKASNDDRVETLVPIRHGRMLQSEFAFFRGTAALQAHDLAGAPASGIIVQACGDCHLMNFGGFATPERNLVFDINDFDETQRIPRRRARLLWRSLSDLQAEVEQWYPQLQHNQEIDSSASLARATIQAVGVTVEKTSYEALELEARRALSRD
jgi:hypothetical protein